MILENCDDTKSTDIGNDNVLATYAHASVVTDHWRKEAEEKISQNMSAWILSLLRTKTEVILVRGSD